MDLKKKILFCCFVFFCFFMGGEGGVQNWFFLGGKKSLVQYKNWLVLGQETNILTMAQVTIPGVCDLSITPITYYSPYQYDVNPVLLLFLFTVNIQNQLSKYYEVGYHPCISLSEVPTGLHEGWYLTWYEDHQPSTI